jgi:uncharacterized protein with FMN-binding domain
MRRSTAAAVGTLTGAALIVGARLSVTAPDVTAAPTAVDLADSDASAKPQPTKPAASKKPAGKAPEKAPEKEPEAGGKAAGSGLTDGVFKGEGVKNPYGTIQVSIKVTGGKIVAADATYPLTNDSAIINPPAIAALRQATLRAQSAEVDAVSGATFTSASYIRSLQAALDRAGA